MEGPFAFSLPDGGTAHFDLLSFGLYVPMVEGSEPAPRTAAATFRHIAAMTLIEQTDRIVAQLGTTFGMSFQILGEGVSTDVPMTWITRFPPGGVTNAAGEPFAFDTVEGDVPAGKVIYRCYSFDEPWELVEGVWTFEFLCGEQTIFQKAFTVRIA